MSHTRLNSVHLKGPSNKLKTFQVLMSTHENILISTDSAESVIVCFNFKWEKSRYRTVLNYFEWKRKDPELARHGSGYKTPVLRIRDVYPRSRILIFYSSRPDFGSNKNNNRGGRKINFVFLFFCRRKFQNIVNYFIFEQIQKKIWAPSSQQYGLGIRDPNPRSGILDPGSGKNSSRIKKATDPGSGSRKQRIPDPQHYNYDWRNAKYGTLRSSMLGHQEPWR